MDINDPFPINEGNGQSTNNIGFHDATTESDPLTGFSIEYSNTRLPLPGFDRLLDDSNPVPSYANDRLCAADIDSFLAEQSESLKRNGTVEGAAILKNGENNTVVSNGTSGDSKREKMADYSADESFMGFQPLDSNGNTSEGSPRVSPLKSAADVDVQRSSGDTSMESESISSGAEEDEKAAEDAVDSGTPGDELGDADDDAASESEGNMEVVEGGHEESADVSEGGGDETTQDSDADGADMAEVSEDEAEDSEDLEAEEYSKMEDTEQDSGTDVPETDKTVDSKSDSVAVASDTAAETDKGQYDDATDTEEDHTDKLDETASAGEEKETKVSVTKHSALRDALSAERSLPAARTDLDTETEDEGKLVIDDGAEDTKDSASKRDADDGDDESTDVDVERTDDKDVYVPSKKRKISMIGFTSMTPDVPDIDSKSMCWCGGEETPEMIACDSPRCKLVWYHYKCVNVKPDDIPEGDWYCPTCVGSGFNNKEKPDKLSRDDEDEPGKRRRKQTLKAREAASDDDIDYEITMNEVSDDDHDHTYTKPRIVVVDDPLGEDKVKKKKKPKPPKPPPTGDSGSEGEYELPSWHDNPKELFEGIDRPNGPRAHKLRRPFDYGWAREIVVRFKYESLKGRTGRPPMDVYYFTPEGKKLRSIIQIGDYLSESKETNGLTVDNFSLNRIPVHKEPWETIRMANMGRSAGSAKGAASRRGRPPFGKGRAKIMGAMRLPLVGSTSPRVPCYFPVKEEIKEEPKSFPEMLNLKPVVQKASPPVGTSGATPKARKSFRPMEYPKRLLNPLEQSMPDPKRPKLKPASENHVQVNSDGGFRLCSLDCAGQEGKPPTLHCGICMCLFHPECVQFVGTTPSALFICVKCRQQSENKNKEKIVITKTMYADGSISSNIPKEPASEMMLPLILEKVGQVSPPAPVAKTTTGAIVPPPPSLKPMTVAAHLKSLQHDQKSPGTTGATSGMGGNKNVVSWSFADGNLKFTNTMPKPPPLKTIRAQLGQIPPTMPTLTSKPTVVTMSPTALATPASSGSAVRAALNNHIHQSNVTGATAAPAIMTSGNSNDIRMAGQLLTLPGNIINRIKMNEPLALKINNQSLVVNPDCFVQTSHGVKIFLPPNTLPVQTGNKTINITVPQSPLTSEASVTTTVSHSIESTIQSSSCTPVIVGTGMAPGVKSPVPIQPKTVIPPQPAFISTPDLSTLKSVAPVDSNQPVKNISMTQSLLNQPVLNQPVLNQPVLNQNQPVLNQPVLNQPVLNQNQPVLVGEGLIPVAKDQPPSPVVPVVKRTRRKMHGINPSTCFIKQLHAGYDSLLEIFSYLPVPDLLSVGQVCRRWRSIVSESWMWRSVRLRGTFVTDWDIAMNFLQKVKTKKLDLRGLHHIDDRNRTWHQITGVLDKMTDLKVIHFGQCPASILHAVTEKVIGLKVLTAEWITEIFEEPQMWTTNTKLDIAKFSQLSDLEELRLRGVCGLTLPSFSFAGGLEELAKLKNLKKLSLTTLKDASGDEFKFIGQLTHLEELEIGDCSLWTEETYGFLSSLENLNTLRMENGGDLEDTGLAAALKGLKKLRKLELVMFIIPSNLKESLSELDQLEELSLWPDPRDQAAVVNTNALNAVKDLKHLKQLEWGVVTSADDEDQGNLPFLSSAFHEKVEKEEKPGEGATTDPPMEVDEVRQDDADKDEENKAENSEEVITTQKLHDQLSGLLVETNITVNDVAVLSSQKGRSRKKST